MHEASYQSRSQFSLLQSVPVFNSHEREAVDWPALGTAGCCSFGRETEAAAKLPYKQHISPWRSMKITENVQIRSSLKRSQSS